MLPRVHQARFSPDGRRVIAACDDGAVRLWDAASGRVLAEFAAHEAAVRAVAFSVDGRRIITGSDDSTARIWSLADTATGVRARHRLTLRGHTAAVTAVAISPEDVRSGRLQAADERADAALNGLRALTGSADNNVKLWDTGVARKALLAAASPGADDAVEAPRPAEPGFAKEILTLSGHMREVTAVSFSPDGRRVLTAARDGRAIVWPSSDWRGGDVE